MDATARRAAEAVLEELTPLIERAKRYDVERLTLEKRMPEGVVVRIWWDTSMTEAACTVRPVDKPSAVGETLFTEADSCRSGVGVLS